MGGTECTQHGMQLGGDGGEQWHSVLRIEGQLSDAAKQLVQLVGDRAIARCRLYQSLAEDSFLGIDELDLQRRPAVQRSRDALGVG